MNARGIRQLALLAVLVSTAAWSMACGGWSSGGDAQATTGAGQQAASNRSDPNTDYVGRMTLAPKSGTIGTPVKAAGQGFSSNTDMELGWQAFDGSWKMGGELRDEFLGRVYSEKRVSLGKVRTDANGAFEATFTVPDGIGFLHDVSVVQGETVRNKAAFHVEMQVTSSPKSGPAGTPITIEAKGIGWRPLENSWELAYDNRFVGVLTAVTTQGTARAVIPATGGQGKHLLTIVHGSFTMPYLNGQQSPSPDRPTWTLEFTITPGAAILPPPAEQQGLPVRQNIAPAPAGKPLLWTDVPAGTVGSPLHVTGAGFGPGAQVEFRWFRVSGNRVSGQGWEQNSVSLGTAAAGVDGGLAFSFATPDDLGGPHRIEAIVNGTKVAETAYTINPNAFGIEPASGPVGTMMTIHLKGGGWTETANIYTLVYDNAYLGYACAFNSQGDITVYLPATGERGWHFIDLYPGIYKGKDMSGVDNFRIPQLSFADDHPGEKLPGFHFAFQVTEG